MARKSTPPPVVDVDRVRLSAFALADVLVRSDSGFHAHDKHQLLYAAEGALRLETDGGLWLVPPERAAFVQAGLRHRVLTRGRVELRTVYFAKAAFDARALPPCRVFSAPPLLREMILHAMRWGAQRSPRDATAERFFAALGAIVPELARDPHDYRLPSPQSPELARAVAQLLERVASPPKLAALARSVGLSERTLERRFQEETGTGYRAFVRAARVHAAMELLSRPRARVTDVALGVGFQSLSSFSRAFAELAGERPRAFLARARAGRP